MGKVVKEGSEGDGEGNGERLKGEGVKRKGVNGRGVRVGWRMGVGMGVRGMEKGVRGMGKGKGWGA